MIAYLRGDVAALNENSVILEVNNIGYLVYVSGRDADRLAGAKKEVCVHTYMHVKEDALQLYGFCTQDDLEIFKLLLGVNGIGPKAALGVLTALSADDLRFAILSEDAKAIAKAPGVGNKTAQKVILELKDKLSLEDAFEKRLTNQNDLAVSTGMTDNKGEAVQALVALGYSNTDALKAVNKAELTEKMDTEAILKAALKQMAFL
ncbi:Holliday junction branch migration protein RuvA [Robinsoniella peoriensis]|uniref:Holliday junction branch migration complex subunit RuvA n=1 Tax=Robinsoniella peoriensis TaxID=180332 RepID=A0A4U8QEW4_9FIRM|nr:Holliday junction branch migration protein RuvA [Robinsoniella peoriensis]MDU7027000.1 Holliday junction branch migration protein RuvA [Clostridiales bacterium]TLD02723.1 Holliday junction ATP-dependent DNA helicase RuvA [Robinsoniella peoriensis]